VVVYVLELQAAGLSAKQNSTWERTTQFCYMPDTEPYCSPSFSVSQKDGQLVRQTRGGETDMCRNARQ
jgi:hypothetical protein